MPVTPADCGERVGQGWVLLAIPSAGRNSVAGMRRRLFLQQGDEREQAEQAGRGSRHNARIDGLHPIALGGRDNGGREERAGIFVPIAAGRVSANRAAVWCVTATSNKIRYCLVR